MYLLEMIILKSLQTQGYRLVDRVTTALRTDVLQLQWMTDTMNRFALESVRYEHSQKHMFHIQTFRKQNKTKNNW